MSKFAIRILRAVLLGMAGVMLLVWGIYSWRAYPVVKQNATESVKYLYEIVQQEEMDDLLTAFEEEEFDFDEENVHIMICDSEFQMVFTSDPSKSSVSIDRKIRSHADKFAERAVPMHLYRNVGEPIVLRGLKKVAGENYYVYIYSKMKHAEMNIDFAKAVLAGAFAVVFLGMLCIMSVYLQRETRVLAEIQRVADTLKEGDFSVRIAGRIPKNEIGELAKSFNEMAELLYEKENDLNNYRYLIRNQKDDIAEFDVMQKRLFGKVTHHLKTPLAIVTSQLELEFDEKDPEKKKYYQDSIMEEVEKMSLQISELLARTKEEPQGLKIKIRRANLSEFLLDMVPKYENWFSHNGIVFETDIAENVYAQIDMRQMEHAVNNYMMNAYAHTKKGKRVILRLFEQEGECVIEVYNEGNGIPEKDIDSIWKSYYQRGAEEESGLSNVGLGLYIVKDIVRQHGGECGVKNEMDGVTFWIKIG